MTRLSPLNRLLPVWILLAMAAGLLLGKLVPAAQDALDAVKVGQTSLPIALGLLLMMYPVLAKVRYEDMGHVTGDRRLLWLSLLLNWVIGPALMFALPGPGNRLPPGLMCRARTYRDGVDLERPGVRR
jgi:ACR3 family arsenite transporter